MAKDLHTLDVGAGSTLAFEDRLVIALLPQQAYAAGGSAGASVTFAVTGLQLPAKYSILFGDIGQAGAAFATSRTQTGFTVNVAPGLASQTLAAGHVDIIVVA